uniref:Talin 2a n=1 Tax=Astyanax mexicanus TaxID=7994 RepID=A0A8B9HQE7_ASTMX
MLCDVSQDVLEYRRKQRPQKVKMLDGAVKTVMVDDSKTVGELLLTICSRIGITNYDEYSVVRETGEERRDEGMSTLRKDRTLLRDERKMEKLKAKLHTDDELNWLDHGRTFREQGVEESETLLLRRKFFYSDQNVDSRDPVQLNLLYVQARDDILNGSHPVSFDKACEFGGIQTQIQFGPHIEQKHRAGLLDLKEFLPKEYVKQRGAEKKIFQVSSSSDSLMSCKIFLTYKLWCKMYFYFWIQNKVDESKHEIHSQVGAITAGTASVVNLTAGGPEETDYTAVGCAITTISSNLSEMSKGVKLLAALVEDEVGSGQDLMRAARTLTGAVSDLLNAVEPTSGEPRQTVLNAAGSIGQASGDLLRQIGEKETDERFQDVLMNLAKAVANAAAMMVLKAKNVAQVSEDTVLQNRVIAAATQCALSTSQLVACAKVVSPTISSPVCQEQLMEAGKLVDRSVQGCVNACLSATDDGELLKAVSAAAGVVTQALADLLAHVCNYDSCGEPIGRYNQATDTIMNVTENIFSSMGDAGEMVRQARVLAQATSDLVGAMRSDAEAEIDVDNSKKLLAAAKLLADATARMVEAAKGAAAFPENEDQQQKLREAAEGLRVATSAAAQNAIKKKLITRLEVRGHTFSIFLYRSVTDSINQLITMCTQHSPGQRECDNTLRELEAVIVLLDNPNEPVNGLSYFDCIESVMENSKVLGESMAGISQNCKTGDVPAFGECVGVASKALCGLTEVARQTSYLVGVSDPNSQAGQQGLVDPIQFARANQAIQMACQNLADPGSSPSQVLSAATIVAKHTSALCNACRLASAKTTNPVAKRHFVQSAKEVANSTAILVKTIKALDGDFSAENRDKCRVATAPLIEAVDSLTVFVSSPEFGSVPAQISREGSAAQEPILQSARSMLDSSIKLLTTARSLVLNPKDPALWSLLAAHSHTVSDSIKSLITAVRDKAPGQRECDSAIDSVRKCIREMEHACLSAVSQNLPTRQDISLEALQEQLMSSVQEVGHLIDPISTAAKGEASQLGHTVSQLASYFEPLSRAAVGVASKMMHHQEQMNLLDQSRTLAESALQMLYAAKEGGGNPKVNPLYFTIKQEQVDFSRRIKMIKMKLDVCVCVFVRENILKTAKALVEDTKNLVSGAASSPEKLARAAQSSAKTITQLTEVVKLGAASIGPDDPETQVVLINAVKDVAKALAELISATKGAAGKAAEDPSMLQLKGAAKVPPSPASSPTSTPPSCSPRPERSTPKTTPTHSLNTGNPRAAYGDGVSEEVRSRALQYGTECTNGFLELLDHVLQVLQRPTVEQKQQLAWFSKRVAGAVTELIQTAESMKGTEWVDPEDPTVIAETELLGAAASIEAAAKKLEQLKPRAKPKEADESLDFEEQILEAAKSIAAATSALVKSASAAQRELVAQGKVGSIPANAEDDGQWSQGLISAARMVAAATSSLCEAANASVQGHASEEKLISSAKQVAASTAQLLVACKVKADQDSEAMRRLQAAGNAVKRASDNLVKAAQKAAFDKADDENVVVKTKFVGGIAQIIAAQEEMLRKERELEEARKKLAQIRQQQYKFLPSELRGDED